MTSLPMSMSPTSQHLQCHHRRCRRQCSSWMVLLFGLFLLGSMTALTTTAAAPPPPFSSLAVAANDVDADAPSSTATATTTTTTFTNTRYRITTSRQLNQFIDDDDNEFDDDVAATEFDDDDSITDDDESEMGGTVCESVIAIASTRAFLEDDEDLDFDEDENEIHEDSNINPIKGMSGSSNVGRARITKSRKHSKSNKNKSEHTGEEFVCELLSGDTVPISATPDQVVQLQAALAEGTLVSAVSTIAVQEVTVVTTTSTEGGADATAAGPAAGGEEGEMVEISMEDEYMVEEIVQEAIAASPADVNSTGRFTIESVSLPPGIIQVQTEGTARKRRQLAQRQRELSSYVGTKPVLVVRVTDVNGLAPVGDAHTMSDKFFGTYGDPETMVTQFKSCSYGAFKVVTKQYPQMSAPGVLDVSIPVSLQNTRDVIRKAIHSAVEAKLGFSATPGPFAHVLYVIEKCYVDCGWAAYAYVNSWLSVYHSKYFMYPAVALHEMGHNLNLGHSGGMDGKTYTDHSCLMGNPLFSDDTADMCYNPAKTHQLIMSNGQNGHSGNWYDASRVSTWNAGGSGSVWSGKLVGVAEYDNISVDGRLVLRIVTGGSTDLYVGFNRKTGMNEDNKQGSDMVTVVQAGAGGITYSTSSLKATLTQGQSYYLPNWRGDGSSLEIFVDVIRTDVVPGYAIVRAAIAGSGGPANPPTNPPTRVPPTRKPSRPPTPPPSLSPITDEPTSFPSESPTDPQSLNKSLSSGLESSGHRARGIMFTVTAKDRDVVITGMNAITRRNIANEITVYTKPGTYRTEGNASPIVAELHAEEWTEIYRGEIPSQEKRLVSLNDFATSVTIGAGQTQSFYAYVKYGLLYTAAAAAVTAEGASGIDEIAAEDAGIIIHEGQVTRGLFQRVVGRGRWGGEMRYRLA